MTGEFDYEEEEEGSWGDEEEEVEDDEGMEYFILQESTGYMAPTLTFMAVLHTILSLLCVVGYYCLKVYPDSSRLVTFTFTFSHLADAFIQSDLQLGVHKAINLEHLSGLKMAKPDAAQQCRCNLVFSLL